MCIHSLYTSIRGGCSINVNRMYSIQRPMAQPKTSWKLRRQSNARSCRTTIKPQVFLGCCYFMLVMYIFFISIEVIFSPLFIFLLHAARWLPTYIHTYIITTHYLLLFFFMCHRAEDRKLREAKSCNINTARTSDNWRKCSGLTQVMRYTSRKTHILHTTVGEQNSCSA